MSKIKTNFVVDAIMFWCMMALAGTGFLRRFRLVDQGRGRGYGAYGQETAFLGLDKHGWNYIHLWLGYLMLLLLLVHIILHWKEINTIYRRIIMNPGLRAAIAVVFAIVCLLTLLFPFM